MQFHGKKSSVMISVPVSVKRAAEKAFELKKEGFLGATQTGWKRAKQLSTKSFISIEDFRYIRNWYARHLSTSYPGYLEWEKAGKPFWYKKRAIISWLTWGGDAGLKWVNSGKNIKKLNDFFDKDYKKIV